MMEDHNRLLPATESGSGLVNYAMRSRGVLVLGCVLVTLGSLLCVGKESQAKPPARAPEPGGSAVSQRPAGHDPPRAPIADQRAAQQEPVHRGPATRPAHEPPNGRTVPEQRRTKDAPGRQVAPREKPAHEPPGLREHGPRKTVGPDPARPVHQRPEERPASAGRDAQGRNADPPGRQVAGQGKPVREQKAAHEAKPAHEPPREHGRGQGPREPVGQDPEHQSPQPQNSDKDHASRPVHEQPAPQKTHNSYGNESSGRQEEGAGSPGQQVKPAILPGNIHPGGKSSAGPPERSPRPPGHVVAAGPKPDKTAGNGAYKPDASEEESPVFGHPDHTGASTGAPDGRPASRRVVGTDIPHRRSPALTLAADETGASSGADPSQRQTGISGDSLADLSSDEPTRVAGSSPAPATERPTVETIRAAVPDAPPGGNRRPVGVRAQVAPVTPFGSAKFLADPLWEERGSLVDLAQETLRSGPVDPRALSKSAFLKDSIAPRGPPLDVPSPFFGFVPMMGGAATGTAGSSSAGAAPLLAVIVSCFIALLYRGRSSFASNFLPPRTVPQPALERPG